MIIKKEYTYSIDGELLYTLIDNVDKVDVGYDKNVNFIIVYRKSRKNENEYGEYAIMKMKAEDAIFYLMNDSGKTLQIIRPANN